MSPVTSSTAVLRLEPSRPGKRFSTIALGPPGASAQWATARWWSVGLWSMQRITCSGRTVWRQADATDSSISSHRSSV